MNNDVMNEVLNEVLKDSMNIFASKVTTFIVITLLCLIAFKIVLNKLQQKIEEQKRNKKATEIGKKGEEAVHNVLSSLGNNYVAMQNILLPTKSGSTELDHILVSNYGIFVIETKNYSGSVYGDQKYKHWKHYDRSGKEHKFYSPIQQNAGHVGTLKRAINLDESAFIPIVVFSGSAELKITAETPVVKLNQLEKTIKSYKKKMFNNDEVKKIVKDIKSANMDSVLARKQHIKHVKSKQK